MHNALGEVLQACLEVNQSPHLMAWFNFSGHVDQLYVRVACNDFSNIVFTKQVWLDQPNATKNLQYLTQQLRNMLVSYDVVTV